MTSPKFPLDPDYFRGSSHLTSSEDDGLRAILDGMAESRASCTSGELHVYADGTSGDDANDGLSAGAPKKTIQAAFDLVPDIVNHDTVVHLSGVFTGLPTYTRLAKTVNGTARLFVDGGADVEIVDDNSGSNYTATAASTTGITDSAASFVAKAYRGYWIEILTGPAAGQTRMIHENTTDTITPQRNWSTSPTIGATFRIVRPATQFDAGASYAMLELDCVGTGYVIAQRLRLLGTGASLRTSISGSQNTIYLCGVINDSSWVYSAWWQSGARVRHTNFYYDTTPGAIAAKSAATDAQYGNAWRDGVLIASGCAYFSCEGLYAKNITIEGTAFAGMHQGCHFNSIRMVDCHRWSELQAIKTSSGYATTTIDNSTGDGIYLENSMLRLHSGSVSNNGGHGIVANRSFVYFEGACAGSGNTGAGVYAHSGSVVHIKDGSPPTLTGTVGDFSTDGTTEKSTWAAIDAGTAAVSAEELTMAKEV